ncbi:hypothetical protein BDW22DRAFT_1177999 [Trametopsis cervina]|nr:hypothetical protein BDW22DRAFT_1177999 [Trametopsis cervina]
MPRPHCLLDTLPTELLEYIREDISDDDLRGHVVYYQSCPAVASAIYHKDDTIEEEKLWKRLCRLSGLSLLPEEDPNTVSWKQIAFDTIDRDGFCSHPHCGGAQLRENARVMREMLAAFPGYRHHFEAFVPHDSCDKATKMKNDAAPSGGWAQTSIIQHIGYDTTGIDHTRRSSTLPAERDAYLRKPGPRQWTVRPEERLWNHPVVCRTMLVFPSVYRMRYHADTWDIIPDMENEWGVTVWDFISSWQKSLNKPYMNSLLSCFLDATTNVERLIPTTETSASRILTELGDRFRDWFNLVYWESIQLGSVDPTTLLYWPKFVSRPAGHCVKDFFRPREGDY